ncbi:MAG TPA: GNAT family N-acetyltransferase [Tissierellia bacterium]|nr:GNAT family N-acetyltransferase [Tissierellia bacterium]
MGEIHIREIKVTDYYDIFLLNQELGYFYPLEKVKDRIAYIIENTKDVVFVAQRGNEVIGYIHGSPYELLCSDPLVKIMGFVVKEKYRNIGVGNMLINKLECWAKEKGYSGITLTSRFERLNAHRFYEKHGYVNIKNQKNFLKVFNGR